VLVADIAAITLALTALRFVWVMASLSSNRFLAARRGDADCLPRPSVRYLGVSALAGVKGAVTLAGILTLPTLMPDGSPFPARDLAIVLATGTILLSLLLASIGLPPLARGLNPALQSSAADEEEEAARTAAVKAAIRRIEQAEQDVPEQETEASAHAEAARRILSLYRLRLDGTQRAGDERKHARQVTSLTHRLRIDALNAERDQLYRLRRADKIDDQMLRRLVSEIDLMEASLARREGL
jgi:CPA1 family monovalent cation:H+ antiporter